MALEMIQFTFTSDKALGKGQILIFFSHEICYLNGLLSEALMLLCPVAPLPHSCWDSGHYSSLPSGRLPLIPLVSDS